MTDRNQRSDRADLSSRLPKKRYWFCGPGKDLGRPELLVGRLAQVG